MEQQAKQSTLETEAAKDEIRQLHQTVERLELELQVCHQFISVCRFMLLNFIVFDKNKM